MSGHCLLRSMSDPFGCALYRLPYYRKHIDVYNRSHTRIIHAIIVLNDLLRAQTLFPTHPPQNDKQMKLA